ncbi:MAG: GNAT family N-acetyltransferase, partial [Saprospiraceae bacterium]
VYKKSTFADVTCCAMISFAIANKSHTPEVARLLAALFVEVGHTPDEADITEIFAEIDADDRHSTLLALAEDGDVVGVITVVETISLYAGGTIGVINELYVVPSYRSEGVGKMLLDFCKQIGEGRGWMRLEVTTPGDEYDKTLHFYEREGFMKIGPRYKYEM